jgi:uncharacterized membrane protein
MKPEITPEYSERLKSFKIVPSVSVVLLATGAFVGVVVVLVWLCPVVGVIVNNDKGVEGSTVGRVDGLVVFLNSSLSLKRGELPQNGLES